MSEILSLKYYSEEKGTLPQNVCNNGKNRVPVLLSARQSDRELVTNYENQSPMEIQYETCSWKCTSVGERIGEHL